MDPKQPKVLEWGSGSGSGPGSGPGPACSQNHLPGPGSESALQLLTEPPEPAASSDVQKKLSDANQRSSCAGTTTPVESTEETTFKSLRNGSVHLSGSSVESGPDEDCNRTQILKLSVQDLGGKIKI